MKKIMLLGLLPLAFYSAAFAKKAPSEAVLAAFHQKFPTVTEVDWEQEKNNEWEAEFKIGDVETSANFSADGKWLETETEIKPSDLPAPISSALKGKKIKEAARILRADGTTIYEAEVGRKDLIFDEKGKRLN